MYNIKKVVHCAPIKLRLKNWFFGSSTFWIYIVSTKISLVRPRMQER